MMHEVLYTLRKKMGVSQSELSRRTGIPQRYISRWESGVGRPLFKDYCAFADAFGVTLDEMRKLSEEVTP